MIHYIDSLELSSLEPYRTLRRPLEHIRQGIFVAEGEKVVRRLLQSGLTVLSILVTPHWLEELKKKHNLEGIEIYVTDKKIVETIVGYPLHQGVMAVAKVPAEPSLSDLLSSVRKPYLLVALDGIVSAENVGVIVRNCGAFGVHGILAGRNSSSPYLRRAVRNSMGAVFKIPVLHADLPEILPMLNCTVIATTPEQGTPLPIGDVDGDLCVVFGNEGSGISAEVLEKADIRVTIPMVDGFDSLNVGSASAVILYDLVSSRQQRRSG